MRYSLELLERRRLLASTQFAVIGDFGNNSAAEASVAALIKSWNPDSMLTVGDNNYDVGSASTIDPNIGQYFHEYIYNYSGSYGAGSPTRRFLPALGNHDWGNTVPNPTGADPYLAYFDLPGNERYYEVVQGPVHFFVIDSDQNEPDGTSAGSVQGQWLQAQLATSTSPHKIVVLHHAAYSSSSNHGSNAYMQWPFATWGATGVLQGHDHTYERISQNGIPYFVNGLGGRSIYNFGTPVAGSQVRYNGNYGAMLIDATDTQIEYKFYAITGALIDTHTVTLGANPTPSVTVSATDSTGSETGANGGVFTFTRTGSTAAALTVDYSLAGSAISGSDYAALPLSVTIPAGQSSATVNVTPYDDSSVEGSETVMLRVSDDPNYATAIPFVGTVNLSDNDTYTSLLFPGGSTWKYKDDGSNQGTAWIATGFDDAAFVPGGARLGYGDPGMVTTINGGPSGNRYITHYFRTTFNVANPASYGSLNLNVLRDDGAIVYLNGSEVWRTNMPGGAVNYQTLASTAVSGTDETTFFATPISPALLQAGTNYWAVELHQSAITTSDAVFDLYLQASVDAVAPAAPPAPDLAAPSDSGISEADDTTNDNTPTFTGTAEAGATVNIFADGNLVGTGTSVAGLWSIATSTLLDGVRVITATATDPAGNVSSLSGALNVTIDTLGPSVLNKSFNENTAPFELIYTFSENVGASLLEVDLNLSNDTLSQTIATGDIVLAYLPGPSTATFTFPGYSGGILPDGVYSSLLNSAGISDVAGNSLAGSTAHGDHVLTGDANHDGTVDTIDFNIFAANFSEPGGQRADGDFNYDGTIDTVDFNLLAGNFSEALFSRRPVEEIELIEDPHL